MERDHVMKWPAQCSSLPPSNLPVGPTTCRHVDPAQGSPSLWGGPVSEGRMLRLDTWGCMSNHSRGERILPAHAGGREATHFYWAILYSSSHKHFFCIFTHPRNQQGDWAEGDTTVWNGLTEWRVCCSQNKSKGQHLFLGMWWALWNVIESHQSERPPVFSWLSLLEVWENDNIHDVL